MSSYMIMSDEQMKYSQCGLMVVLVMLGIGIGWSQGCLEDERLALFQLKPFFPFIDSTKTIHRTRPARNFFPFIDSTKTIHRTRPARNFFPFLDFYESEVQALEEKESSADCCEWERIECNPTTGRVTHLFLNQSDTEVGEEDDLVYYYSTEWERESWYLNASLFLPFEELQTLSLRDNSIAGCVDNQGFERLSFKLDQLEILDLSYNDFNDSIFASLSELSSLKSLNLAGNAFTGSNPSKGIKMLSKLNNLETLDLTNHYYLGNDILSQLDDGFTSLKSLRLQNCGLKGTVGLLEFNNLTNLKELYLGINQIESLGSLFHEKGRLRLNKLEVLGLSGNLLDNSIFSSIGVLSNLKSLYLGSNNLKGSIHVKDLNALSYLEVLSLSGNEVTDFVPSQELRMTNLEVLRLGGNHFNSSILLSLASLSNLKVLSLGGSELKGPIDIQELNGLSNLEELYMDCYYSDGGCSLSLQSLSLFPSLKILTLDGFNFSETTMTSHQKSKLNGLSNLEELYIYCYYSGASCSLSLQSLGLFPSLKILTLYGFNFSETTMTSHQKSKLNGLRNLEELHLDCYYPGASCSLSLQSLGLFPSLKILKLYGFNFSETTMTSHQKNNALPLKNLELLDVYSTSLGSNFLQKIGAGPSIKVLRLEDCELNGTLHTQGFCGLTNLRELVLANNNLKGNLSECFSNSTFLENLDLSSNQLRIPSSLEPFFNLSKLKRFNADNNTIYVESEMQSLVPRFQLNEISLSCCGDAGQFPQFLYHQRDLQYVDLSNINLKGDFPDWLLQNNTKLRSLDLANNSLLGPFELSFTPHTDLSYLDISKNDLYGKVPIEIGAKLPSIYHLNMSKNHFYGSIPASIGDLNSLEYLDLSDNILSGGLPEHLAMGCFSLYSLALSNNMLQGPMFSSAFNLTNLSHLLLDGNHFSGKIPDSLSNSDLLTLDVSNNNLSGEIPRWMENMSFLSTLDLSKNEFSGEIPRWIGKMSTLEELVMSNNHLEGPFPVEFCNLNLNLKLLDLSVNNISGSIPSCFSPLWISQVHLSRNKLEGPLTNVFRNSTILVTLDLSNNHLTGKIPNWIGNLSQLSYLLLNNNHFEGGIPVQLCNLGHLSLIDLSNNNLSGTIPPCLKITTLNEISQDYVRYVAAVAQAPSSFSIDEPIQFTAKNNSYSYKGRVLTFLSGIDLSCNKLTGEIPHDVKNFRNIFSLNLSHNSLTGPIPLAFSELKQIESLDLSHNNLSGKIPPQLVGLYSLSYFRVGYNNLSGSTPQWVSQFATFDESSYVGNPFLCGKPLPKNCSTSGPSPSSPPKATTDDGLIDMTAFYPSFVVSYIMVILTIASVLYINPYWRRAWFYHIGAINTCCYYFLEDHILPTRFHWGKM